MIFIILYSLNDDISNIDISSQIEPINERVTALETSFPAGCDTIVSGCTTYGSTPASNSPSDIIESIKAIYTDRYTEGYNAGYKLKYFSANFAGLQNAGSTNVSFSKLSFTPAWCFVVIPSIVPGLWYDSNPRTARNLALSYGGSGNIWNATIGDTTGNYMRISKVTASYVTLQLVITNTAADCIKAPAQTVYIYAIGK